MDSRSAVLSSIATLFFASPAVAYDVIIDADQNDTTYLTKPGNDVLIASGVRIATEGDGIVGAHGDSWRLIHNAGEIASSAGRGISLAGPAASVFNAGSISAFDYAIVNSGDLQVTNNGSLVSRFVALQSNHGALDIANTGTIQGGLIGILGSTPNTGPGIVVDNWGLIQGSTAIQVSTGSHASVMHILHNHPGGRVIGDTTGISSLHGTFSVYNDSGATIQGEAAAIHAADYVSYVTICNAGAIIGNGPLSTAIRAYGGGNVINEVGGTIRGAGGVSFVRPSIISALTNAGTIEGQGATFVGGWGSNAGAGTGVYAGGGSLDLTNVKNASIEGTFFGVLAGEASIFNSGVIRGDTGMAFSGAGAWVENRGTIVGRQGVAIEFDQAAAFDNVLHLATGSTITGSVLGGAGVDSLILSGRGSEDGIRFRNFDILRMDGQDWAMAGGEFSDHVSIWNGTLRISGTLVTPDVHVAPGAALAGDGMVSGNVTNAGAIMPGSSIAGDSNFGALIIRGNYVGKPGATVEFSTEFPGDTDRLVIDGGSATGTTQVFVYNAGGIGAPTNANGIELISAINGGVTDSAAFAMPGRLRVGAYDYRLFRGGLDGDAADSWFLRSELAVNQASISALMLDMEAVQPFEHSPILGPEIATYGVVQPIARSMAWQMLGDARDRQGDGAGAWGRWIGATVDHRYASRGEPSAKGDLTGLQIGTDVWAGQQASGPVDRVGVQATQVRASVAVDGLVTNDSSDAHVLQRSGRIALRARSMGAYWTHVGPQGAYLDVTGLGTRFDGEATTADATMDVRGNGVVVSVETGRPFPMDLGPGFVLEPQVQLAWQGASFRQTHDGLGRVLPGATRGSTGRLGVHGRWRIEGGDRVWEPEVRANVWQDWGALSETTYDDLDVVPVRFGGSRMAIGGGLTARLSQGVAMYANLDRGFGIQADGGRRFGIDGTVGVRVAW